MPQAVSSALFVLAIALLVTMPAILGWATLLSKRRASSYICWTILYLWGCSLATIAGNFADPNARSGFVLVDLGYTFLVYLGVIAIIIHRDRRRNAPQHPARQSN